MSDDGRQGLGAEAERLDVLLAAARIDDVAKRHPELFEIKTRAPAMWKRLGFWVVAIVAASIAQRLLGLRHYGNFDFLFGMFVATLFVYFDPPPIVVTRKLKSAAASPTHPHHPPEGE